MHTAAALSSPPCKSADPPMRPHAKFEFAVPSNTGKRGTTATLLSDVTAYFQPNRLAALMVRALALDSACMRFTPPPLCVLHACTLRACVLHARGYSLPNLASHTVCAAGSACKECMGTAGACGCMGVAQGSSCRRSAGSPMRRLSSCRLPH